MRILNTLRGAALLSMAFLTILVIDARPANAQSLGDVLGALGSNGSSYRYRCGGNDVLAQVECRSRQFESARRQREYRQREELSRQQRLTNALDRACRAGDQESCRRVRSAGVSSPLLSALIEACNAGDQRSCQRVYAMRP